MSANGTDDPLEAVIRAGDLATLRERLQAGESPDQRTAGGLPLVSVAAMFDLDALDVLAEFGADVDCVDQYGSTALTTAAATGRDKAVRALIVNGADVDRVGADGSISSRPIWRCVLSAESNLETLVALVDAGADRGGTDEHGKSLRDYATTEQQLVIDHR